MKKILVLLLIIFSFINLSYAKKKPQPEPNLTFIYINGSNNNDEKMKDWYIEGVHKLHPVLKRKFERNYYIKKWNKNHNYVIAQDPYIFFWGYDSKADLDFVKEKIDMTKTFGASIPYKVRYMLTKFLHDAIWIQKDHHMLVVLDSLNDDIKKLANQNQNVALMGYSAGSFVTYQYMVYKIPYVNLYDFFADLNANSELLQYINENPKKNTCLSAITHEKNGFGIITNKGKFILNQNTNTLKRNYDNIENYTEQYCAPEGRIKMVVNFASPTPLFYSDINDDRYELNLYTGRTFKYILENGIYYITVNFREDPMGIPSSKNMTVKQVEEKFNFKLNDPTGVIYDSSRIWSKRMVWSAHTSYWSATGCFSNGVTKAFVNGTKFMYDEKYQKKVLKRKRDPEVLYEEVAPTSEK